MQFKTGSLEGELWASEPRLVALVLYVDRWAKRRFGHELLFTDFSRTQEEYDSIYSAVIERGTLANGKPSFWVGADGRKHYAGPMPHLGDPVRGLRNRAADAGVRHGPFISVPERLSEAEAEELTGHVNAYWPRRDGKRTALFHNVGSGPHVHLQVEIG